MVFRQSPREKVGNMPHPPNNISLGNILNPSEDTLGYPNLPSEFYSIDGVRAAPLAPGLSHLILNNYSTSTVQNGNT